MSDLTGLSILLLEDEYLIALDTEQSLKEFGVDHVDIASTLPEAEKLAAEGGYDVALLDVNINGEMSFPLAQSLRKRGIPVVFATGYELRGREIPGPELGATLNKPYTKDKLKIALMSALAVRPVPATADAQRSPSAE